MFRVYHSTLTRPVFSPCPASAQQVDCQSQKPISICRCCPGHKTHPLPFLRIPLSAQNQIETAASLKELANLFQGPLPNLSKTHILAQGLLYVIIISSVASISAMVLCHQPAPHFFCQPFCRRLGYLRRATSQGHEQQAPGHSKHLKTLLPKLGLAAKCVWDKCKLCSVDSHVSKISQINMPGQASPPN